MNSHQLSLSSSSVVGLTLSLVLVQVAAVSLVTPLKFIISFQQSILMDINIPIPICANGGAITHQ